MQDIRRSGFLAVTCIDMECDFHSAEWSEIAFRCARVDSPFTSALSKSVRSDPGCNMAFGRAEFA